MSATVISFVNFKGGVGKSALTVNLGYSLAYNLGEKVLVVDLDPQSNASIQLMGLLQWKQKSCDNPPATVYGLLMNNNPISYCIIKNPVIRKDISLCPNLHVLPSCYDLMDFEHEMIPNEDQHYVFFWKQLKVCLDLYDFILIDCPPNLYRTTECAIFSSHHILVPCNPDGLSLIGLSLLGKKINYFKQKTKSLHYIHRKGEEQPKIDGIIMNNCLPIRTRASQRAEQHFPKKIDDFKILGWASDNSEVFNEKIRHSAHFNANSFSFNAFLTEQPTNKDLIDDYRKLAVKIRNRYKGGQNG